MTVPHTEIRQNARWELLRCLAMIRDEFPKFRMDGTTFVPLYEAEWQNAKEDIWLAAREAAALGDIEFCRVMDNPASSSPFAAAATRWSASPTKVMSW